MNKTGWKTYCFGRYLVDLPPDANISAKYKLWDTEIVRLGGYSPNMLMAVSDKRETELKAQKHDSGSSMFLQRTPLGGHSIVLVQWESNSSKLIKKLETYISTTKGERAYRYSPEIDASNAEGALRELSQFITKIHPLAPSEIPTTPGFCIDGAYIAGNEWMNEVATVSVDFPKYPGVDFGISFYAVGKPDKPLLERVGGTMTELLGRFAGLNTLRRGKHPVGPIPGEEIATVGSENGQRLYAFKWEFQGKPDSLEFPNINVELGLLEQTPPPPTPPFKDDAEALELWDAIVDSIRLRPGAV